jgi:peptidoglycan/LPS O-acetylase OafA/YrhL
LVFVAPTKKPSAIPALTGVRFVAAFLVLTGHAAGIMRFPGPPPFWHVCLSQLSGIGMPLFFVLSGFVIHYNYSQSVHAQPLRGSYNFFVARFARLYPMYFVVLCVDLFFHGHFDNWHGWAMPYGLKIALASYLPLVQSWHYQVLGENSLTFVFPPAVQVAWSISTEWFFYLCYPFLCIALARLRSVRSIAAAIVAVIVVGYASIHLAFITSPDVETYAVAKYGNIGAAGSPGSFVFWLYYLSPYPRLLEFVLGALTAAFYMAVREAPVSRPEATAGRLILAAAIIAIAIVYLALFTPVHWLADLAVFQDAYILRMYFTFAPFMAAVLFCCARYPSWVASLLSRREIVLCGEASYSIYLVHMMVIEHMMTFEKLANMPPSRLYGAATVLTTMLIVISVSLVTYRVIEVPARRALRSALSIRQREPPKMSALRQPAHAGDV